MKKIFSIITVLLLCTYITAGAEVYGIDSDKTRTDGVINKTDLSGYENVPVYTLNGTGEWTISNSPGIYRISYWVTPDLNADDNASIMITSEFIKKTVYIDHTDSSYGWYELCMAECGPAGMSVILNTSADKYANVCAVKFEQLSNDSRDLCNFCNLSDGSIALALYSDTAYVNGTRVHLSKSPIFTEDGVYVAQSDIFKLVGSNTKYTQNGMEFVFNQKTVSVTNDGFTVNGELNNTQVLKQADDISMVNIDALFKSAGKHGYIYNNSLALYSNSELGKDSKSNEKQYKNILASVRFN